MSQTNTHSREIRTLGMKMACWWLLGHIHCLINVSKEQLCCSPSYISINRKLITLNQLYGIFFMAHYPVPLRLLCKTYHNLKQYKASVQSRFMHRISNGFNFSFFRLSHHLSSCPSQHWHSWGEYDQAVKRCIHLSVVIQLKTVTWGCIMNLDS